MYCQCPLYLFFSFGRVYLRVFDTISGERKATAEDNRYHPPVRDNSRKHRGNVHFRSLQGLAPDPYAAPGGKLRGCAVRRGKYKMKEDAYERVY